MIIRHKGDWGRGRYKRVKGGINGDRRRLDFGWYTTMQYTDDVLQNRILESYRMLLTDDTTIELIKFKSDTD